MVENLSRIYIEQKTQMEALEAAIDDLIESSTPLTYRSTTRPNQVTLEAWWVAQGKTLPIPPQTRIYWHDTYRLRALFRTTKDFFAPLVKDQPYTAPAGTKLDTYFRTWAIDRTHFIFTGVQATSLNLMQGIHLHMDQSAKALTGSSNLPVIAYDPVNREVITLSNIGTAIDLFRVNLDTGVNTDLGLDYTVSGPPYLAYPAIQTADRTVYTINNDRELKRRTNAGTITTLVDLDTLSTDFPFRLEYDATTNKIIVFFCAASGNTSVWRLNSDGTGGVVMVASQAFGGGWAESVQIGTVSTARTYRYWGAEVRNGKLYVPETGLTALNVNRRRRIDIATNTYEETELFDFGAARAHLENAVKEATAIRELDRIETLDAAVLGVAAATQNTGNHRAAPTRYWGVDYYSGLLTKLVDIQRLPDDDGWLLTYWNTWGPGPTLDSSHSLGNYFATSVLPDDGNSGQLKPVTQYGDGLPDYVILKSYTAETSMNSVTLEWGNLGLNLEDFDLIEISFDSGLSATDTISVRFNGVVGAYTQGLWRLSAATNTYSSAAGGTSIVVPSVAQAATTGGRYKITARRKQDGSFPTQIEGFLTSGVTTTLTNSVLGGVNNQGTNAEITSVTIFTTAGTAQWTAGAQFEVAAIRTKSRYFRTGRFDGPYLVS